MRGKAAAVVNHLRGSGITPAYAGKSIWLQNQVFQSEDHPRVCGEKTACMYWAAPATGSPPRMRGKGTHSVGLRCGAGITPAYAGKSFLGVFHRQNHRDHPRVCGEKNIVRKASFDPQGSPPRMRGKEGQVRICGYEVGITPAYAGKSPASGPARRKKGDHPRVCGEKFVKC